MRGPGGTPRSAVDEVMAMAYHILVVEDEPDTRELLDFTLRWNGHHVDTATNGREALDLLAEHSYDVILSNLNMPEMGGEDLYRRIEHGWPHLAPRVVFVTAARPDPSFRAQYGGRPVPVLTKPYTPQRLLEVIDDVVARDV
jgi:CheY-like chemotaxis protein